NGAAALLPALQDAHGPLELVGVLQHLLAKIFRQARMIGQEPLHGLQRRIARVAADERAEPASEEEDPAVGLNERQRVERGAKIWQRDVLLPERVERAEASARPVFVERP